MKIAWLVRKYWIFILVMGCFCLSSTLAAVFQKTEWIVHKQPGGGTIKLPKSFKVIGLAADATSLKGSDGTTLRILGDVVD